MRTFDRLSPEEQRIFIAKFLRRRIPLDSGPRNDETIGRTGAELFEFRDAQEGYVSER